MRTIGIRERRARLGLRHGLATPFRTVDQAAEAMIGLHSSDPATVFLSARSRVTRFRREDLEDALYDRRSLVRMLGMRRTLFVTTLELAAVVDAACTKALVPGERRRLIGMLEDQGIAGDGAAWLRKANRATMRALRDPGELSGGELSKAVPELRAKLVFGEGKTWGGEVGVSTRVLFLLATEGTIVRGRPLGTWVSGQYRWAPTDAWLGAPLPTIATGAASAELLRRWLLAFGPATATDIRWFMGWTQAKLRAALLAIETEQVALDDGTNAYLLADDADEVRSRKRWVALLPGLDPTTMGWKERDWYLGPHGARLFDRNGNAGPTVWADGRIVGGWGQRADASVVVRYLEPVEADTEARVEEERVRLESWLDGARVTARFRTPLEKEIEAP
ncbi:MAG: winged helix DNA-binding domain-containing protein [Actinobacteria bacterium]|nr:MAG: winged helix DNA-binding domain-containing protein [Actinomycetota bacterium]